MLDPGHVDITKVYNASMEPPLLNNADVSGKGYL